MLTQEEDMEIAALRGRGWSVSAIARHTGRDRKTIRAYLAGQAKLRRGRRVCSSPTGRICRRGSVMTRTCWVPCCSASWGSSGSIGPIRRSRGSCERLGCVCCVSAASAVVLMSRSRSIIRRGRSCSSTGWSCARCRGARRRSCSLVCCRIRGAAGACSARGRLERM
jgi:hypothetical protein